MAAASGSEAAVMRFVAPLIIPVRRLLWAAVWFVWLLILGGILGLAVTGCSADGHRDGSAAENAGQRSSLAETAAPATGDAPGQTDSSIGKELTANPRSTALDYPGKSGTGLYELMSYHQLGYGQNAKPHAFRTHSFALEQQPLFKERHSSGESVYVSKSGSVGDSAAAVWDDSR